MLIITMDINELKQYVKKRFDEADMKAYNEAYYFDNHLIHVFNIADKLQKKYGGNKKVILISSLLHDIGLLEDSNIKNHEKNGAVFAKEFLKNKLDKKEIESICNCIECHDCNNKK